MAENEKFNGDCKLLQDRLRRFCELTGRDVRELEDGSIFSEMAYDTTLTLYAEPLYVGTYGECKIYGCVGYTERKKHDVYIDASNVQYYYEKINKVIAEIEQGKDRV